MKTNMIYCLTILLIFCSNIIYSADTRSIIIEDFETGILNLTSYSNEDLEPDSISIDSLNTFNNSEYSLKMFGNSWKVQNIDTLQIDSGNVWNVSTFVETKGEILGFAIADSLNILFYSLDGTQLLNIEEWITVYQGAFEENEWLTFDLPVADDWFSWYEYYPKIEKIIYINDCDYGDRGVVYFDDILNVSDELSISPSVTISYTIGDFKYNEESGSRTVDVTFESDVIDPDSDSFSYLWNFGDDLTSTIANPFHTFNITDDHSYSVLLEVTDETDLVGYAAVEIDVSQGPTSFPIKMNFVGDIILARAYEDPGGIIPTQGVEAIFEPTKEFLGDNADITVANLECPLTTHPVHHPTKTIYFKGSPENAEGLAEAGIDIVSLANNHVIDYMLEGMRETQEVLAENGIKYSGAGENTQEAYKPLFYSKYGLNLAFLASSDRTGQYNNYQPYLNAGYNKFGFAYMTPYYLKKQIEQVREYSDLVIIETHSGSEYSTSPGSNYDGSDNYNNKGNYDGFDYNVNTPSNWLKDFNNLTEYEKDHYDEEFSSDFDIPHMWDREIRHHMIDSGADLVICHHPHIIQGFEIYNSKLIAHSLGNFVFDLSMQETCPSVILNTEIDETGFSKFTVDPIYIDDFIPLPAAGELGKYILNDLAMKSKKMDTYLFIDNGTILADIIIDTLAMTVNEEEFISETIVIDSIDNNFIYDPKKLERTGSISKIISIIPNSNNDFSFRLGREIIWMGNMEDEGASLWNLNSNDEFFDENEFYEGRRSICLKRDSTNYNNIETNLEKVIKKYYDTPHSLHGYIKAENGADITIEVKYYYNRYGSLLGTEDLDIDISGDMDWTFFSKELDIPSDTRYFDILLISNPPDEGVSNVWFDNIGIINWTEWQFADNSNMPIDISTPNDYYFTQLRSETFNETVEMLYSEKYYGTHTIVGIDDNDEDDLATNIPHDYKLKNYPNPFNPETTINFVLQKNGLVELSVYNIIGQKIKTIVNGNLNKGNYKFSWNGDNDFGKSVGSGIYMLNLKSDRKSVSTRKCIIVK